MTAMKAKKIFFIFIIIVAMFCSCSKNSVDVNSNVDSIFNISKLPQAKLALYSGTPIHQEILEQYPDTQLVFLSSTADMLLYTRQKKADCFAIGESEFYNINGNKTGLTKIYSPFKPIRYACIFSEAKLDVRKQFNEFLSEVKADGRLDSLINEWIFGPEEERVLHSSTNGKNGTLKVATESSHQPFTYLKDGIPSGFEIALMNMFGQDYGYIIEVENCGWDPMNAGVLTGKYDIGCSNIMYSEERAKDCYFSDIYYEDKVVLGFVNPDYIDLKELSGKKFATVTGSIFDQAVKNQKEIENPEFLYFESDVDLFNSVINGKADAGAVEYSLVHFAQLHGKGIKVASDSILDEETAFIFTKNSPYREKFNQVISKFKKDGTIDKIMEKWFLADSTTKPIQQDWEGSNGTINLLALAGTEPISYIGANGEVYGFDVDIALHIARELDYKLEIVPADFSALLSSVAIGKADIGCGSIAITEERKKEVDFSDIVYNAGIVIFMKDEINTHKESFIDSIKTNLEKTFVTENRWKMFVSGCLTTLTVSLVAIIVGTILGFAMFMACRTGNKIINKIADIFLWFINGIPVVVFLMILYYVVFGKSSLSGIWVSSIGFIFIFASGVLGMLKTGVSAVDKGQEEGGLALGYSPLQTFFKIILPQAARVFMPSYKNEVVQIIKATSIVGYIAVQDLTKVSDLVRSRTFAPFFPLIVSAVFYFIMAWLLTIGVTVLIRKISPTEDRTKRAKYLKGVER